jgi:hypothetical protein
VILFNIHWNEPRNPVELKAWDRRVILTDQRGQRIDPPPTRGALINHYRLVRWYGISGKRRQWFLGFMLFHRA